MAVRRGSGLPCLVYLAGHDLTQKVVHQSLVGQAERYRLTDENYALVLQGDLRSLMSLFRSRNALSSGQVWFRR